MTDPKRCPTCGGPEAEPLIITEGDLRFRCVDWFHPCNTFNRLRSKYPAASGGDDTPASEPTPSVDQAVDILADAMRRHLAEEDDLLTHAEPDARVAEAVAKYDEVQEMYDQLAEEHVHLSRVLDEHRDDCDKEIVEFVAEAVREANEICADDCVRLRDEGYEAGMKDEREACAKLCDDGVTGNAYSEDEYTQGCCGMSRSLATDIRARGKRLGRDMTESTDWNVE